MTGTDPDGEIVALSSGGYDSVTVNQSASIISPSGVYVGITVFGGTNGVTINTPGVNVTLRGLTINGLAAAVAGIDFQQGAQLTVEGCEIANVGGSSTAGIFARAPGGRVVVKDTMIRDTLYVGIWVKQETGEQTTRLTADNVAFNRANAWPVYVGGSGHVGSAEAYLSHVTIVGASSTGVVADSSFSGGATLVSITNSTITNNGYGVFSTGTAAKLVIATSTVARNASIGLYQGNTSTLLSRGDNTVHDNGTQTSGTIGPLAPL